jgi:hypothetical protein
MPTRAVKQQFPGSVEQPGNTDLSEIVFVNVGSCYPEFRG